MTFRPLGYMEATPLYGMLTKHLELAFKHSCKGQKLICVAQEKRNQDFPMCAVTAVIYHISALVPLSGWKSLTSDTRAMFLAQSGSALLKCISTLTGCQPVSLTTQLW